MADISKDKRISKENQRLRKRYKDLPKDTMDVLDGLFDRAAYLRVELEDMETDMIENGRVELFTQSEKTDPYEKERPVVRQYVQFTGNYSKIIKQLDDKLPKIEQAEKDDGFDDFRAERDEA